MERLFHLAGPAAWRAHRESTDSWQPASLETEGFVHLSFSHQLAATLAVHFASAAEMVLVEVDPARFGDALRVEESRGDESFPHLYRAVERNEWARWWTLRRTPTWELPHFAASADEDRPIGIDARQAPE